MEVLSRQECLRLLAEPGVGRVALNVGALPAVLPVSFTLVGDGIVFPAAPGGELAAAVRDAVVAFEADDVGPAGGWSVVVTGIATEVTDSADLGRLGALHRFDPADDPPCFFRIPAEILSGRRIPRPPLHVSGPLPVAVAASLAGFRAPCSDEAEAPLDGAWLEPIPAGECLTLLATEEVGRLAVVVAGQPLVFPLNYALDGDAIVFRTAPGTKLEAMSRSLVTFEVDRWTPSCRTGWTVVVKGWAQEVTSADGPGLRERLAALPVHPLADGDRLHYVRIVPVSISGSRLRGSG